MSHRDAPALRTFTASLNAAIPGGGRALLDHGGVGLAITAPWDGHVCEIFVRVNVADGSRDYDIEVLANGSVIETIALASGNTDASAQEITGGISFTSGQRIRLRVVRTLGSGKSTFTRILVWYSILEDH